MKNKKTLWAGATALLLLLAVWYFTKSNATDPTKIMATVRKADFEVIITATGELRAKNQTDITAPAAEMQEAQMWNGTKISNLVPEGTVVKAGDFVATLDQSPLMTKISEASLEFQKKTSELNQAKLDTTLTLRDARDELSNLKFQMEQNKLEQEQSIFEAPAVQKMKGIEYEKARKSYDQKKENYKTKQAQASTKIQIINADLMKAKGVFDKMNALMGKMTIMAPKSGMVIYQKDWSGRKVIVGTNISPWDPTVAVLPDLSEMQVVTYVNEVDVQKIKPDQAVSIGLDADPKKKLQGVILQVANVGEQRPNSDSKVFEVVIDVLRPDPDLRPSMTTSCRIQTGVYKNALSVPLEAINNEKGRSYVYKKEGGGVVRQAVQIATQNDKDALIFDGLTPTDEVYLTTPADTTGLKWFNANPKAKAPTPFIDRSFQEKIKARNDSLRKLPPNPRSQGGGGGGVIIMG